MKEIKLTQGHVALVDDEDYERLSKFKWQYTKTSNGKDCAARRAAWNRITKKQRNIPMSHEVLEIKDIGSLHVDHVNRDRLDNRRENLRICTPQQNQFNRGPRPGSSSKYKGVSWKKHHGAWVQHELMTKEPENCSANLLILISQKVLNTGVMSCSKTHTMNLRFIGMVNRKEG